MFTLRKLHWKSTLATTMLVAIAFLAGMLANQLRFAEAGPRYDAYSNQVYEILAGGSPTTVYTQPDAASSPVDIIRWGDRVLWDGLTSQTDAAGNRWVKVFLAEGVEGWMTANIADVNTKLKISSAVYTTPGIAVGRQVRVTQAGDHANFRAEPTVKPGRDNILRFTVAGETLTVISGPYQAEYFIWWQYQDTGGQVGWIVDIEGWFEVIP